MKITDGFSLSCDFWTGGWWTHKVRVRPYCVYLAMKPVWLRRLNGGAILYLYRQQCQRAYRLEAVHHRLKLSTFVSDFTLLALCRSWYKGRQLAASAACLSAKPPVAHSLTPTYSLQSRHKQSANRSQLLHHVSLIHDNIVRLSDELILNPLSNIYAWVFTFLSAILHILYWSQNGFAVTTRIQMWI